MAACCGRCEVAIVNSELLHRDGETIMEMLQDSGIKSIT